MGDRFFVKYKGQVTGPHSKEELRKAYQSESFRETALARLDGSNKWFRVSTIHYYLTNQNETAQMHRETENECGRDARATNDTSTSVTDVGVDFGSAILIYSNLMRAMAFIVLAAAVFLAIMTIGMDPKDSFIGVVTIASGLGGFLCCLVMAELLVGAVHLVRNSARIRQILEVHNQG